MSGASEAMIVTKTVLSELFGVAAQSVDNWIKHGCPRISRGAGGKPARFDLGAVLKWYRKWKDEAVTAREELDKARTLLTQNQNVKVELEIQRLMGILVLAADVDRAWAFLVTSFRARMLALPTALAPQLAGVEDLNAVRGRLETAITDALEELSSDTSMPSWVTGNSRADLEGAGDSEAAPEDDALAMGGSEPAAEPGKQRRARAMAH